MTRIHSMNTRNFTVIALFCFATIVAIGQEWAPIGAKWHYQNEFNIDGYITIESVAEQMMGNKMTKVLYINKYRYDYQLDSVIRSGVGVEYTYLDSGKVYYYRDNKFYILYDFEGQPNDQWSIHGYYHPQCDSSFAGVVIDSIGTTIVGNDTLKHIVTSKTNFSYYDFIGNKSIERIGNNGFMFPYQLCIADVEPNYGPLRCYEDSSLFYKAPGYNDSCDHIRLGFHTNSLKPYFDVFPNPTYDKMLIRVIGLSQCPLSVSVININGIIVKSGTITKTLTEMELNDIPSGIYFVEIKNQTNRWSKKIIKQF